MGVILIKKAAMNTQISRKIGLGLLVLTTSLNLLSCRKPGTESTGVKKISFLLTNDIHGHLESVKFKNGSTVGGMAYLGNIVDSIRQQPEYASSDSAFFVLDSGDQFQGTLLSNYNEGQAMFKSMNEVGYDAAVPGNHDYDFGPIGWLYDKVTPGKTGNNPKEVIEGLAALAKFPLLSANTYYKNTIHYKNDGSTLTLDSECKLKSASPKDKLDFENASRPNFLKPYTIIQKAGVRVALIGLDNHATASTTTIENINDLCFRDEVDTYLEIRKTLEGKADVFVLMMHNGNSDNSKDASKIVETINNVYPNGVNLAAAGHTHFIHNDNIAGVPVMQDGAENRFFGRADLFFDLKTKKVVSASTASRAGITIDHDKCAPEVGEFCKQYAVPLIAKAEIQSILNEAEKEVAPLSKQYLGEAKETIGRSRISESAISNILTDALRAAAKTEISFMNTGGIRADLTKGPVLYENIFEVLPFSNMGVVMNQVPWSVIKKVLTKSVQTCGKYGALMQSGLKVRYSRTCSPTSDVDPSAKLTYVETLDGRILLNVDDGTEIKPTETFSVATLDFLASGGSGYGDFTQASVTATLGIAREMIVSAMAIEQPLITNKIDGRFKNITP
jgi:5'-nucleotidase